MVIEKLKFTTSEGELPMEVNLSEMDKEIASMLKTLRLSAMKESYLRMVASDEIAGYTATELLYKLLSEQTELRRNNTGAKRAKAANLWMPDARLALLEEHEIHINTFQLEQYAKFNFVIHGGLLKVLVSDQFSRNYLASALGAHACMNKVKTLYIKFDHLVNPEYRDRYERDIIDIDMLRNIPLLIIDDWLSYCIDEKNTNYLKSILEFRFTRGKGTILASCYKVDGWTSFLKGTANTLRTFKKWFEMGNEISVKGCESVQIEDIG